MAKSLLQIKIADKLNNQIKEFIKTNPRYATVSDFVRHAIAEKLDMKESN